jgi:hypothetical protein
MTRASVSAQLQRNWHILTVAGTLVGVTGARLYTDQDRQDLKAAAAQITATAARIDLVDARVTRLETAITILALKACGDSTTGGYEALYLKCAELRGR